MKIPLILIPLALIVGASIFVWSAFGPFPAFAVAFISCYCLFFACLYVNCRRSDRIRENPLSGLSDDQFRQLCRQHADARITFYDSVLAGNCIPGTLGFVRRTFPWRLSITLGELLPYCKVGWRIKNVALYKLIQLSNAGRPLQEGC